jgi:hypothetical protein
MGELAWHTAAALLAARAMRLTLIAALSLAAAIAHALPPRRVSLHYTRAADAQGCTDPAALARAVEAYTGPVLVSPASADASLEAHVEAVPGGFRARIQLARADGVAQGERVLDHSGSDCRDFTAALAFVIATTIDPDLVLERVGALFEPSPPREVMLEQLGPARPAAPEAAPPPATPPEPPAPAPPRTRELVLGAGLVGSDELGGGNLSPLALGPSAFVRGDVLHWLALGGATRALFPTRAAALGEGDISVFVWGLSGLACPTWRLTTRLGVALCVGVDLSLLRARSSGIDVPRGGVLASVGAAVRPQLSWRLPSAWSIGLAGWWRGAGEDRLVYSGQDGFETYATTPVSSFAAELTLRRMIRTRN